MINLLSPESKKELRAARRNVILRKYVFTVAFLIVVITGSYAVGYGLLVSQEASYKSQIAQYEPQRANYTAAIKQANEYNKNLSIAKSILSNELSYSSFVTVLAKTMPANVVMVGLTTTTKDLQKPVELSMASKSYDSVIATKDAFEASPYFSDVKIRATNRLPQGSHPYQFGLIVTFDRIEFTKAHKEGRL